MKRLRLLVLLCLVASLLLPAAAFAQAGRAGAAAPEAPAVTFTVNSAADPGSGNCDAAECTLREAIIAANANGAGKDTIIFNIPGAGPHVITLAAALQAISQPIYISGLSQSGSACGTWPNTLKIVLNGSGLAAGATGLKLTAGGSTVQGLVIQRFPSHGVEITSADNQLMCNYIGTNSAGSLDLGNGGIGVYINNGGGNYIVSNLISGNNSFGLYVGGANAASNVIVGNRIGVSAAGNTALGNGEEGVMVESAATTIIGGSAGNIISGNAGHGIVVNGNSPGTIIAANAIGTNAVGSAAIPNGGSGIAVNSPNVDIGGTTALSQNIISGNSQSGIVLDKPGAQIRRNLIGVAAGAAVKLGNGSYGIYVRSSTNKIGTPGNGNVISGNGQDGVFVESGSNNTIQGNYIGTNNGLSANLGNSMFGVHVYFGQNTLVGGATTNVANFIAFNGADGVYVPNDASQGTRVNANAIFSNGDLGIDLGENGVTPNDSGDADAGPNNLQNFPVLASVGSNGSATHFVGALNSQPGRNYRVEFFVAGGCDPSGYGEGRGYLGAANVTTNAGGTANINALLPTGVSIGASVTATATDADGNTSEFGQCKPVAAEQIVAPVYLPAVMK